MAHLIIEYSANLDKSVDMEALANFMHEAALTSGVFPLKGLRTRVARRKNYTIADAHPDNGFIHVVVKIGFGRSDDVRKATSEHLFSALTEFMQGVFDCSPLALSLEIQQIDPLTSHKKNNLDSWIEARQDKSG